MPWPEFAARLERQLKRRGWQWTDFGSRFWVDHRLPICAFNLKKAEERAMATHFSNLQILPAEWNRRKNGYSKKRFRRRDFVASGLRSKAETGNRRTVLKIALFKKVFDRKLLRPGRFACSRYPHAQRCAENFHAVRDFRKAQLRFLDERSQVIYESPFFRLLFIIASVHRSIRSARPGASRPQIF
jgi:hypothetical protein